MTITLDGTNGITTPALTNTGTETLVNLTTTGNTTLGDATTDTLTVGVTGIVKDASGNVGIGTASPLTYSGTALVINGSRPNLRLTNPTTGVTAADGGEISQLGSDLIIENRESANIITYNNGAERMRIDSSGNLLVGTTSAVSVGAGTHILSLRASSTSWGVGPTSSFGSFYVKNGSSYGVVLTTTATSWASDSDERKKTEITPFVNAVEKVCSLRAGTGSYLSDANNISRSFLIAQDVQKVLPQAIDIGEDADKTLMLRYTDLIPLLVASIKELKSTIDTQANTITSLTTRISALEAK